MAEIVSIRVTASTKDAVDKLQKVRDHVDYLNKTPVVIKVEASDLEKATKAAAAYNNSIARKINAENALKVAVEKRLAAEAKARAAESAVTKQIEATATAEEKARAANSQYLAQIEKTATAKANLALQEERSNTARIAGEARLAAQTEATNTARIKGEAALAVQQEKTATATAKAAAAQRSSNDAVVQGTRANDLLTASIGNVVARMFSLYVVIRRVVSAFREALSTMKEVDSELVTIQKTTGFTGEKLEELTRAAYDLAAQYGRTATEILQAASVYARAGFKDNLEQMTELSALLQNVGDLEGEVAAKFIVATNAAWKLNGSYDALLNIIDGLNAQTNEAAVDMDALTSGITVAGSVFASAGESVQTFAGMLGAGVALTARSGSEIGRGLRTIAMNIRQIKGELEDGEIIDEESISDAAKALHSVGISIADAQGELRLTSDVLDELAKKWGSLTTAEQSYLAQSLAGKRQANILTSLMQNWQEVERQMDLYANGAGSALQENEIYLNSWEAKTKQLNAAWTDFVSNLVDTDLIKKALDTLIGLVNFLNTGVGRTVVISAAVGTAVVGIVGAVTKLKIAIAALNGVMAVNPIFAIAAGATAGILLLTNFFKSLKTPLEQLENAADAAKSAYDSIASEVEQLSSREDELTDIERRKLEILREQAEAKKQQADAAAKELAKAKYNEYYRGTLEGSGYIGTYLAFQRMKETASREEFPLIESRMHDIEAQAEREGATQKAKSLIGQHMDVMSAAKAAKSADEIDALGRSAADAYAEIVDMAEELEEMSEILGEEFPENGQLALNMLMAYINTIKAARDGTKNAGTTAAEVGDAVRDRLQAVSEAADDMDTAIGGVTDALEKYGKSSVQVYDAMVKLEKTIPGSTDKLYDFETATLKVDAGLIADKASLLDFISSSKTLDLTNQIKQLEDAAKASWNFAIAIAASVPGADPETLARQMTDPMYGYIGTLKAQLNEFNSFYDTLRQRSGYTASSSKSSSSATTQEDEILAARKQRLEYLKAELAFLQASGASTDKIVAKEKEIQAALHDVAERMREISGETADTVGLSTEWWNIQKDILAVQQEMFDTLKGIIDEYYDAAVTDKEKELTLEEKILAVQKAQVALENAQNERTVRYYNAATGQWERTANRQNVKSAQDALKSAQDDLNAYQKEQAWAEFKSAWEYVTEQIKAGAMTFADAYDYMYKAMKGIQDKYDYDMSLVLEDSIGSWNGLNKTIKDFDAETGKVLTDSVGKLKAQMDSFTTAIDAFKEAFDTVKKQIEAGSLSFGDAYKVLYDRALQIDGIYGTNMANALNAAVAGMDRTTGSIDELWKQVVITLMRTNSVNWHGADAATQAYLHAQNVALAKTIGAEYDPSGYWYLGGQRMYDPTSDSGAGTSTVQDSGPAPAASYTPAANQGNTAPGTVYVSGIAVPVTNGKVSSDWNEGTVFTDPSGNKWRVSADGTLTPYSLPTYDSGGVLRGLGGIKATAGDELVLPPDVTRKMLDPVNNEYSMRAIDDLRWMFGLRDRPHSVSEARSVTNNSGATYNFGGITLTEEQAKRTTVYDFAQLARGLGAYNGRI